MRLIVILFAILVLAGCATSHKTKAIRGQSGLVIECSGMFSSWDRCYLRAAKECKPKSFKVVAKSSDVKEDPEDYPFGWNPAGMWARRMLVVCH
ncbi:MAG: hypothetical protein ACOH2R_06360 [Pseudomonas sp.]